MENLTGEIKLTKSFTQSWIRILIRIKIMQIHNTGKNISKVKV